MEIKEYRKKYYLDNKDKILANSKRIYNLNKESILQRNKDRYNNNDNLVSIILERSKRRAKINNLPFNIELADIVIPEFCPVFGIKLERARGKTAKPNSPSIDKIIPELGYVKGNVQIISYKANCMKSNATREELLKFAKWILKK